MSFRRQLVNNTVRALCVVVCSRLRESRVRWIEKARTRTSFFLPHLPPPPRHFFPAPNFLRASSPLSESLKQTICVIKYETMTHQRQLISDIHLDTKQKLFDYKNHIFLSLNHDVENTGSKWSTNNLTLHKCSNKSIFCWISLFCYVGQ